MSHHDKIDQFLFKVRRRLNQFRFFDVMIWASVATASVLAMICLFYIFRGYAVPKVWFIAGAVSAVVGGVGVWIVKRWSKDATAHYADEFFGLKDSVATSIHFRSEDRGGDFVHLQERTTATRIEENDPSEIRYRKPGRLLATAAALIALCTLMAFKEASPEIVEKQRIETETNDRTAEINEFLEDLIEELDKDATDEEKEILEPDKLKEWVDKLEQTRDRKEALRQYAQLERKLQEAAKRLDQRKNEQLLTKAGKELQKDDENRALGKKMEEKKFREAAADLQKMKPKEIGDKKLSEQRKELARLKAASQRMAAAAKAANRKGSANQKSGNKHSNSKDSQSNSGTSSSKSGEQAEGSQGSGSQGGGEIDADIAALEKSLGDLEKALQNAELQEKQMGKCDAKSLSECKNCRNAVLADIDKLSKSMCQCASKSECKAKLLSMCKSLGQCQSYCQSKNMSLAQCLGAKAGGLKAGTGSVESRRSETDELTDNGNTTMLKGIKGSGPSQSSIEAAEEGSGVSSRRATSRKLEFSRQVESFVQREDVPDDVKMGVKNYFENIHQGADTK